VRSKARRLFEISYVIIGFPNVDIPDNSDEEADITKPQNKAPLIHQVPIGKLEYLCFVIIVRLC